MFFLRKKGFTLIEVMVVIVIMGVLAAVAVPQVFGMIERTRRGTDAYTALELRNILVRAYETDVFNYEADAQIGANSDKTQANRCASSSCYVAVAVQRESSLYRGSGDVLVYGKNWVADKVAYERIQKLFAEAGFLNTTVQCKNVKDGGWSSYIVVLFSDGKTRILSSDEDVDFSHTGTGVNNFESVLSKAMSAQKTNIEVFLGNKQ